MQDRIAYLGITFDDVLLEPGYSDVVPKDTDVRTQLTRNVRINIPIISSPMDTVTESELAIALAQEGGIGIIHKNLSVAVQTREVDKVKRSENGIITDPITLPPDDTVGHARKIMEDHHISGVPITVDGVLKGILTRRDLKFLDNNEQKLEEVMTKKNLVVAPENTTLETAEKILTKNKVEKLLLVDDQFRLKGLITIKDIDKTQKFPNAAKDARGRLKVGAAVGVRDYERAASLIEAGVDVLVVDSAHGHSRNVIDTVRELKKRHTIDVIAGNVATAEGARALADAGADGVKAGIGPGCFAAGTRVLMANGTYRNIEDVRAGDRVINMNGQPVTVVKAWCTGVREVIAVRHTASFRETLATPDHRYWVCDRRTGSERGGTAVLTKSRAKLKWKEVGSLAGEVLLHPNRIAFELPEGVTFEQTEYAKQNDERLRQTRRAGSFQIVKPLGRRETGLVVPVYDIEVDCPTHSFIADNAVVHNSICTTRIVSGVGVPQMSAIANVAKGLEGTGIPLIADGGIRYSGDITKALAAGAFTVMIGGLFAGLAESPGQLILYRGRSFKQYRGMGSLGAMMAGSADRYHQGVGERPGGQPTPANGKLVPEGVEGRVPFKGNLAPFVYQLVGGVRAGMGYCGCKTLDELRTKARFIQVTAASVQESHPHDIAITQEAPNYSTADYTGDAGG
jgi:inosine-5'-monophosphate dehydrogenase